MDIKTHLKACQQAIRDGHLSEAEAHCRAALDIDPDSPSALNLIGILHRRAGRLADAERAMARALDLAPDNAALTRNLGLVELSRGKTEQAMEHLRRAVSLQPDVVEGHLGLARACARLGLLEEALRHFSRARSLAPDSPEIPLRMGRLLLRAGQPGAAAESFGASLALKASPEALTGLAEAAVARGAHAEAESLCRQALALDAGHADAMAALAAALFAGHRPDEARQVCEDTLARDPGHVAALGQLARIQRALGDWSAAEETYRCARALSPTRPDLVAGHARVLIALGQDRPGWDLLDSLAEPTNAPHAPSCPRWNGEAIDGRTLLLTAASAAEAIQFCRYASPLQRLGARVIVRAPVGVLDIIATAHGVAGVERHDRPGRTRCDFHCPVTALPRLAEQASDGVPTETPYLRVPDKAPPSFIGGFDNVNVGIAWRSDRGDPACSLPLHLIEPAMRMHGVRFHALQQPGDDDEAALLKQCEVGVASDAQSDLVATAASLASLDLLITADTAVAHLAAALGRPTWLLSHFDIDWIWQARGQVTPWYPTMRIFRQRAYDDWLAVTGQLVIELARLVGGELALPHPSEGDEVRPNTDFPAAPARMRHPGHPGTVRRPTPLGSLEFALADQDETRALDLYGECCRSRTQILERLLHRGDTVFIGGAGFGGLALALARRVGESGRVIAWEPDETERARLARNRETTRLPQVEILDALAANATDSDGTGQPKLLIIDLARVDEPTLARLAPRVDAARTLIYLLNAGRGSRWLAAIGYRALPHRPLLFVPDNPAGVTRNVFGDRRAADLLGCPLALTREVSALVRDLLDVPEAPSETG